MNIDINPSDYRLFAFDLDGTLIASKEGMISPFTKQTLERLRAKGYLYTIATGRILPAVKKYAEELNIDIPLIMSNGGILQTPRGELISQTCLPLEAIQTTIKICREYEGNLALYICDKIYVEELNENMQKIYGRYKEGAGFFSIGAWENIADKLPEANKCVIVDTMNEENLVKMQPILQEALNGSAITLRTSTDLLEVQPNGVTKADGLRALADSLGIGLEQVIAFGDYDNDVEMLKAAGLGIAVGQATPACLESADLLVASPEEDGPAHFLEANFLNNP